MIVAFHFKDVRMQAAAIDGVARCVDQFQRKIRIGRPYPDSNRNFSLRCRVVDIKDKTLLSWDSMIPL